MPQLRQGVSSNYGIKNDHIKWRQNILWMTDIRSGLYEKPIANNHSCTCLCKSRSNEVRQSTWEKTWYSQNLEIVIGGFHRPLGWKNTILLWMTDTWSGLYEKALVKAQSHMCLCKSPNSDGAYNLHGRTPGKAKILLSQGFSTISKTKKHHIKRKRETRWTVKVTIFLWWLIPNKGCTEYGDKKNQMAWRDRAPFKVLRTVLQDFKKRIGYFWKF